MFCCVGLLGLCFCLVFFVLMEKLLASLGAPINPAQIGVSSELVEDAVILAKEVRDRFTLLQVLWDTGLLDEYAKMIAAYFGVKANC